MKAALLACAVLVAQALPAPPGRMIDIGARKLHLHCSGSGAPAVILVAGGSAYSIDWALVQPRIAAVSRVCSYDRAGLGWSDAGPADETVEQTVGDLHTLLRNGGERAPVVLVGASIGGVYIRAYQRQFPSEVAGLVFSNSSNRVGLAANGANGLLWDLSEQKIRNAFPLPPPIGPGPSREGEPFDRLPADLQAVRLQLDVALWKKWTSAPEGPASLLSWRKEFLREFDETESGPPRLGALPVAVITSDPLVADAAQRTRDGAAARLAFLSTDTTFVVAAGSGHEVHLYQPDTVVRAIDVLVAGIRSKPSRR
jgi:pimeloyl-ACP methyl ester carboxylesterase